MREGHHGVELDRKPPIWCSHKYSLARNAPRLTKKSCLPLSVANMLQDRTRVNVVEFLVGKREIPAVGKHKSQSGIHLLEKFRIVDPACSNPFFVWIPGFKVVGMAVCPITRDSHVEHSIFWLNPGCREKSIKHLATLVGGYLDRD
jgi:hypothetical protein